MMRQFFLALALSGSTALSPAAAQTPELSETPEEPAGAARSEPRPARKCPPGFGCVTNRPLPRYVSLKGSEARARRGPGSDHRVDWLYQRQGLPLKVTAEYENWRRVEDSEGAGGWIHFALLSSNRSALVTAEMADLHSEGGLQHPVVARAQASAVVRLLACQPDWCRIAQDGIRGWVKKSDIWGVEAGEVFD